MRYTSSLSKKAAQGDQLISRLQATLSANCIWTCHNIICIYYYLSLSNLHSAFFWSQLHTLKPGHMYGGLYRIVVG